MILYSYADELPKNESIVQPFCLKMDNSLFFVVVPNYLATCLLGDTI